MTRIVVATDNFNRASLGANWANQNTNWGTVQTSGSTVFTANASNTNNEAVARWVGAGSFTDDQYSEVTIGGLTFLSASFAVGVIVRASADTNGDRDHYFAEVQADSGGPNYTTVLGKVVNGTRTELHSAALAWVDTDKLSLEVEGTTLRVCKNGTALGGSFTQTDASLSTGLPGILANGSAPTGDDCEVGNLSSVPPNPIELGAPLSLSLTGTLTVAGDFQFGEGPAPADESSQSAFYRLVRKGKPRRYLTPQRDLERFAERAFEKPDPPEVVVPRVEIELPAYVEPLKDDRLDREIAQLSALLEAKTKRVQRKIVKAAYDDDDEILALL